MDKVLARSPLLVHLTSNICCWPPPAPNPDLMFQSQTLAPDPGYTLEQPFHPLEFSVVLEEFCPPPDPDPVNTVL
eukprot:13386233-Ditylum_brightwellii.AAC.1